jgi:hypothetical protein
MARCLPEITARSLPDGGDGMEVKDLGRRRSLDRFEAPGTEWTDGEPGQSWDGGKHLGWRGSYDSGASGRRRPQGHLGEDLMVD